MLLDFEGAYDYGEHVSWAEDVGCGGGTGGYFTSFEDVLGGRWRAGQGWLLGLDGSGARLPFLGAGTRGGEQQGEQQQG